MKCFRIRIPILIKHNGQGHQEHRRTAKGTSKYADARKDRKREGHMTSMTSHQVITLSITLIQVNIIATKMAIIKTKTIFHRSGRMTTTKAMTRPKLSKNTIMNTMKQTRVVCQIRRPMLIKHKNQVRFVDVTR